MDKILSIYLDPRGDHPDVVNKFIFIYKGVSLFMSEDDKKEFVALLPEFWYTENDKITSFTLFSNQTYYCERQKKVYNYSTKVFEEIPYRFDAPDQKDIDEFVQIAITFFDKVNIRHQQDIQQKLLSELKTYSLLQSFILNTRKAILSKTDFMFLRDYNGIDSEELQKWENYRQQWRDITEQESWKLAIFHEIKLPISPAEKENFTYEIMSELGYRNIELDNYISSIQGDENFEEKVSNLVSRYCEFALKQNIISVLGSFKLPLLDFKLNTFYDKNDPKYIESNIFVNFEEFSHKIDEELKRIGSELTVSSIISHYKNMTGNQSLSEEIINILNELEESSETSEGE